jgi:hypothetical protein
MNSAQDDYVQDKTRHIVGRAALRRVSRMVQDWQTDERENARLARHMAIGLTLVALFCTALFIIF